MAHRDGLESEAWIASRNLYSVSSPWTGVRELREWSEASTPCPCHHRHRQTDRYVGGWVAVPEYGIGRFLQSDSCQGLEEGRVGKGDLRMGFFGIAGEPGGLREGPVPSLQKSGAATHVSTPWTYRSLILSSGVTVPPPPRGRPEVGLGKGYVINLEPWMRQLSTCLRVAESLCCHLSIKPGD